MRTWERARVRAWEGALLLSLTLSLSHPLTAQDAAKIAEEVRLLNDPARPQMQVQASMRLEKRGAAAVPAILDFVKEKGRNGLSLAGADLLGRIKDDRLADLCAELVADKDFFWRPMAMQALAFQAPKRHAARFREGLSDRLWGVRSASVLGLENVGDKESLEAVKKLLADAVYDVRAQAAKTLHAWGDASGLPVLVEALRAEVRWFDIDYGQLAREDAWKFLKKVSGDEFGFKPWEGPKARAPGLARWDAWMDSRDAAWRTKLPEAARCRPDTSEYVFGFELRSCQRGDFFFRIDTDGNLVLGFFNLERAKLDAAEKERFDKALAEVFAVDRDTAYGKGGCDFEQYYLAAGEGKYVKLWIGAQGRPPELDGFIRTCHDLVKAKFGQVEAADFKERTDLFRGPD